jgi:integrase
MPTIAKNAKKIDAIRPLDRRVDYSVKGTNGLYLVVHPSARRVWGVRYQTGSGRLRKRHWHEIGTYSDTDDGWNLARACEEAKQVLARVSTGTPLQDDLTAFGDLFQLWLEEHAKKKLNTWADEEKRYKRHLEKPLGFSLVAEIERKDVREIRDSVAEDSGPIESNRVVALFNRVMNWAVDDDRAKFNPAARLKKVGEEQRRERILTEQELKRLWQELDKPLVVERKGTAGGLTDADRDAAIAVRRAIKLLVLLGQRRGEVIGIAKAELDGSWWTIPKERTKNGLPHRVPLSVFALTVIDDATTASGDSPWLFPSHKTDGPIRPDAVTKQLQRLLSKMQPPIEGAGPHDLRRTVGTTMRKLGISVEDRGYVFNHVSGAKSKVTSWNYDAGEHDVEKVAALDKWTTYIEKLFK